MVTARIIRSDDDQRIFDALADPTRRQLIHLLASNDGVSITTLSANFPMSRQAVSKHLQVIEEAGLVTVERQGRERLLHFSPEPLSVASTWVQQIEHEWDARLDNLKRYLVDPETDL